MPYLIRYDVILIKGKPPHKGTYRPVIATKDNCQRMADKLNSIYGGGHTVELDDAK